jgi:hypothetical protein
VAGAQIQSLPKNPKEIAVLKFTQITNVRFYQVLADAQIAGTYQTEAEAFTKAAQIVASTGSAANVYTLTHESVRVERE